MNSYSPGFRQLIDSPEQVRTLLTNSSFDGSFGAWEKRKVFIAESINKDGTFLDVGCGNGFLLRCLQEWSPHKIIPFGVDINPDYISQAKQLFTSHTKNFIALDINEIDLISEKLPPHYDFVYFSRDWTKYKLGAPDFNLVKNISGLVNKGGRLIIGFYGEDKSENLKSIEQLRELGAVFDQVLENPSGTNLVAWLG